MFQPLQGHLQGARNVHLLYINCFCLLLCYISCVVNYICKVNVHYEPPEDGLVKAETYVGVKE
jgi:hypothetical protein